jgi:transposase InsO family protein
MEVKPMPWKETNVTEEKIRFVLDFREEQWTMTELCKAYGISRKTGYRLISRSSEGVMWNLEDRSRAPHTQPNRTSPKIEQLLVAAREKHPTWGPRKLIPWLEIRHPSVVFPASSTVGDILKRHELVKPRKARQRTHTPKSQPLSHALGPNDVWCADYKGWFRTKDGLRCEPLTITDSYSRCLLTCRGCPSTGLDIAYNLFKQTFEEFGLPLFMRTDNGSPFASPGIAGLSVLSVWWLKLGIRPERIEPGRPDQNGRHERMHLTLKQETAYPPKENMKAQQRAFDAFRAEYNTDRPHEALGNKTPSQYYQSAVRTYPRKLDHFSYDGHLEVSTVDSMGSAKWRTTSVHLSPILKGERVGFEQVSDSKWKVYLGPMEIALFDSETKDVLKYTKGIINDPTQSI